MKNSNKKGFTIVELVIVIAVIAILAAVLVPVITNVVKKANVSADTQLIRNLNTALATDSASGNEHNTMQSALDAAEEAGYVVSKISTKADDNQILWDSVADCFCYLNGDEITYTPDVTGEKASEPVDLWIIADEPSTTYSTYLYNATKTSYTVSTGLDVGNENVTSITYSNSGSAQDVVIRTNGGSLTVNAANDTVNHYGFAAAATITAVDTTHSYHEYGVVREGQITSGHLVVELNGYFGVLDAESTSTVEIKGQVESYTGNPSETVVTGYINNNASTTYTGSTGSRNDVSFTISSVQDMYAFKYQVECGRNFSSVIVNLTTDLNLGNFEPIGDVNFTQDGPGAATPEVNSAAYFSGIFNGNGHTLSYSSSNISGDYALFLTLGSFDQNSYAEVKNLKMNVNLVASDTTTWIGALADYAFGFLKVTDCEVSGTIESGKVASGFIGWCISNPYESEPYEDDIQFIRCTNKANITVKFHSGWALIGGICSQVGVSGFESSSQYAYLNNATLYQYSFIDCKNEGTLTASGTNSPIIGEILGQGQSYGTINITGCTKGSGNWIGKGTSGYGSGCVENISE